MLRTESRSGLLVVEYMKFCAVFLLLYFALLSLGAFLLRVHFLDSLSILGPQGPKFLFTYLGGIQLFGLGFGWIGYGTSAIHRETQMRFWELIPVFLVRGPLQRTGKPSWQTGCRRLQIAMPDPQVATLVVYFATLQAYIVILQPYIEVL